MTDEEIKALLQRCEGASFIQTEPRGMNVILRSRVDEADAEECKAWVDRHGGYEGIVFEPVSKSLGRSYGAGGGPVAYWAIPPEALASG